MVSLRIGRDVLDTQVCATAHFFCLRAGAAFRSEGAFQVGKTRRDRNIIKESKCNF